MHILDTWAMEEIMLLLQMEQGPGGNDRPQALPVAGRSLLGQSFNPFFGLWATYTRNKFENRNTGIPT